MVHLQVIAGIPYNFRQQILRSGQNMTLNIYNKIRGYEEIRAGPLGLCTEKVI